MSKESEEQATPERWSARAKTEVVLRLFRASSAGGRRGGICQRRGNHPSDSCIGEGDEYFR